MRKTFYAASLLVVLGGCTMQNSGEPETIGESLAGLTADAVYTFKLPQLTNSCLDVNGASQENLAKIQEWSCNGTGAQSFKAESVSGSWRFRNTNSQKCLDVNGAGTANGTAIIQWDCHTGGNQLWNEESINGYKRYRGVASGRCIDVSGASSANGTVVQIWDCNGSGAQTWNPASTTPTDPPAQACTWSTWTTGTNYSVGQVVKYPNNGNYYRCTNANPGYDPTISTWFWEPYTCGTGSPPPPQPPPSGTAGIAGVLTSAMFASWFPGRDGFYTYDGLISTSSAYAALANQSDQTMRKREVAALLANLDHESGGLGCVDEIDETGYVQQYNLAGQYINANLHYCDQSTGIGCPAAAYAGQKTCGNPVNYYGGTAYYGRGPIQLSFNYNYKTAGNAIGSDLLNYPGNVSGEAPTNVSYATAQGVAFKTASWYWMTQPGPSTAHGNNCHDGLMSWGFGATIEHINGAVECGQGCGVGTSCYNRGVKYKAFCDALGVSYGSNLGC
jgi:chitinase